MMRLAAIEKLHLRAAEVLISDDRAASRDVVNDLLKLAHQNPQLARARAALQGHADDIIDGADMIKLAERELMSPLDEEARRLVSAAAQRVSVVTAVSPRALIDVLFVFVAAMRLIRQLARLYGGRPGTLGMITLLRHVIGHLAITGGMAVGDSLVQQVLGHGIAAKLSQRLGEGVLNGLLTARLGLAAIDVTRPLPFTALPRPALGDLAKDLVAQARRRGVRFRSGLSLLARLPHLQPLPAPIGNALGDGPCDNLGVGGRAVVEEFPRARDHAGALHIAEQSFGRKWLDWHRLQLRNRSGHEATLVGTSSAMRSHRRDTQLASPVCMPRLHVPTASNQFQGAVANLAGGDLVDQTGTKHLGIAHGRLGLSQRTDIRSERNNSAQHRSDRSEGCDLTGSEQAQYRHDQQYRAAGNRCLGGQNDLSASLGGLGQLLDPGFDLRNLVDRIVFVHRRHESRVQSCNGVRIAQAALSPSAAFESSNPASTSASRICKISASDILTSGGRTTARGSLPSSTSASFMRLCMSTKGSA